MQPDGTWELRKEPELGAKLNGVASTSDDDDDLIEITKSGDSVKMGTPRVYGAPPIGVPSTAQSSSRSTPSTSSKRPASAVIDLTSSGDEEEPIRAPKRPFTGYPQQTQQATPFRMPPPPGPTHLPQSYPRP